MITLRGVEVLGRSGVFDIEVAGQTIQQIRTTQASPNRSSIEFENAIAFPGLINSHDHLEFDCYPMLVGGPYRDYIEWSIDLHSRHSETVTAVEAVPRELRVRLGIARNLLCGVTSVAHHGSNPGCTAPITIIQGTRSVHSPRMDTLRGMLIPNRGPFVVHVGEGTDQAAAQEIDSLLRWNVWRQSLIGVHAISMRAEQATNFAAIVWCPVSNEFLYGRTAAMSTLRPYTSILFGTDSTLTGSWNIWEHLRRARKLGELTDDELIASITTNAANVWKLPGRGRIAEGGQADVVVARRRPGNPRDAFFAVEPEDIQLVMSKGRIVLLDASLGEQTAITASLFPVVVNGVTKLAVEDYRRLAAEIRSRLPSIPVPIS